MDRVANFLGEKTPRRFIAIVVFLTVLYLFRHLAMLLVFFVTFERAIGFCAGQLEKRAHIPWKKAVLLVVLGMLVVVGGVATLGVGKTVRAFTELNAVMPEKLANLKENPLVERIQEHIGGTEKAVESAKHYAGNAIGAASAIGHFFVHVLVGFILAIVFCLEKEELATWWSRVDRRAISGTMGRWLGHVADATVVTVQLQLIVAAFNTVTTLPVLLLLGVPHVGGLMILVFVSALVPVIGNIVSGTVLCLLAYQAKGWLGVGIFVGLTFILHKIESYYLNPRLTSRHVKMPGFLLIATLLACEHLFGFAGLFLSFPILFVTGRIRGEFLEEDAVTTTSAIMLSDSPDQLPTPSQLSRGLHSGDPTGIELDQPSVDEPSSKKVTPDRKAPRKDE